MKTKILHPKAMLLALILIVAATTSSFAQNLINGDFETGPAGTLGYGISLQIVHADDGWYANQNPGRTISGDAFKTENGNPDGHVLVQGTNDANMLQLIHDAKSTTGPVKFQLDAYNSDADVTIRIYGYNGDPATVDENLELVTSSHNTPSGNNPDGVILETTLSGTGGADWNTETWTFDVGEGYDYIAIAIGAPADATTDTRIDNVILEDMNESPIVDPIPDQPNIPGDAGEISVSFTGVVPGFGATQIISATATSSDQDIIPNPEVTLNAEQTGGEITFTPTNTKYGTVTITLTLQDDGGTADGREDTGAESFNITVTDPAMPRFGVIPDKSIFVNSGENLVFIPDLSGGSNSSTDITIEAISSDNSIVEVTGTDYDSENTFGIINIQEKGVLDTATITVTVTDPDGSVETTFDVMVVPYTTYGWNWSIFDVVFWQEKNVVDADPYYSDVLPSADVPGWNEFDYDQIVLDANTGNGCQYSDCDACCMGTVMLKGYIIPPETGNYVFHFWADADHALWLSSDESYDNAQVIARISDENGNIGSVDGKTVTSDFISLEAGKVYAIYGIQWPVFHPEQVSIEWETPSGTREIIGGENSQYLYDTEKPTAPASLALKSYSSTKTRLSWEESTDDGKLAGYNLYVNGNQWNSQPLLDRNYEVTGLTPDTDYSFTVTSVDEAGNESGLSNIVNVTTYPEDNTPPDAPENITATTIAPMALEIAWDEAVDNETGIYGYNVYVDGDLYNTEDIILETSVTISVLQPENQYAIEVEAIDAGENATKSNPVNFTTPVFDPLAENLGVKTGRLHIEMESMGASKGFGVNAHTIDNDFTRNALKELQPTEVRWGTLTVNPRSLQDYSGTAPYTIADFFSFVIDTLDASVSFTCGVSGDTDWVNDENTFLNFLEYLGGDETTTWGQKRINEGYSEPFLPKMKHLNFEFGNETWGNATHHVAEKLHGQENYTKWCMEMEDLMKTSPYYDAHAEKISFVYSGRNPDPTKSWGVNNNIFDVVDTAHMDVIGLGGYLNANVGDGGEVEGEGIVYYQNLFKKVADNVNGLKYYNGEMLNRTGEVKKTYFYETDASTDFYYGRVGQTPPIFDHALENIKYGSIYPCLFSLKGGKWAMINRSEDDKRMPKFILGKFINDYAVGQYLRDSYETNEILTNGSGREINLEPVGTHVIANDNEYNIILSSRDYTSDHYVQINLPDGFTFTPTSVNHYVFTGDSVDSQDAYVDTLDTFTEIEDGMIVKVPKYSMVFINFAGEAFTDNKPLGYVDYVKQEDVQLSASTTEFTSDMSSLLVEADITPADALGENVYWSVSSVDDVNVEFVNYGPSIRIRSTDKEGAFTIRGTSLDDSEIYDELEFTSVITSINDIADKDLEIFPNPVSDVLNIKSTDGTIDQVNVFNMQGNQMLSATVTGNEEQINMSGLKEGSYIIELKGENKNARFIVIKK